MLLFFFFVLFFTLTTSHFECICFLPRRPLLCVTFLTKKKPDLKGPLHLTSFVGVFGKNHWSVKMASGRLLIHKDRLARQLVSCPHVHKPRRGGTYTPHRRRLPEEGACPSKNEWAPQPSDSQKCSWRVIISHYRGEAGVATPLLSTDLTVCPSDPTYLLTPIFYFTAHFPVSKAPSSRWGGGRFLSSRSAKAFPEQIWLLDKSDAKVQKNTSPCIYLWSTCITTVFWL